MTSIAAILVLGVIFGWQCLAQDSEQYGACLDKAVTQGAMNACASDEARRLDTELDELYKKVLGLAGKQSGAVEKIRASERAWIVYRDAYMAAMYPATDKQGEYGSIYPMEANLLRAKMTQQQIGALRELLRQYSKSVR